MNLIYGLKNDELVNVNDVQRGLECGCVCPFCKELLIAKKGEDRQKHFAHKSGVGCEYGYETSLHYFAKKIIEEEKCFYIPGFEYKGIEMFGSKKITPDLVELECVVDDVIPDVTLHCGNKRLFIEIYVSHKIDAEKKKKIQEKGYSVVEIDLSKQSKSLSRNELRKLVIENNKYKYWVNNPCTEPYIKFIDSLNKVGLKNVLDSEKLIGKTPFKFLELCKTNLKLASEIQKAKMETQAVICEELEVDSNKPGHLIAYACPRRLYGKEWQDFDCNGCEYKAKVYYDSVISCNYKYKTFQKKLDNMGDDCFLIRPVKEHRQIQKFVYFDGEVKEEYYQYFTDLSSSIIDIYARFSDLEKPFIICNQMNGKQYIVNRPCINESVNKKEYYAISFHGMNKGVMERVDNINSKTWRIVGIF